MVWVAGYTPRDAARAHKRAMDFLMKNGEISTNSPNGFVVTFTIFNVLFQVVGHFNGGPATLMTAGRSTVRPCFRYGQNLVMP